MRMFGYLLDTYSVYRTCMVISDIR